MPIRPENADRYPPDWPDISLATREAAGWRCQCLGECGAPHLPRPGRCLALQGFPNPVTLSRVVLTVAHLDNTPENCDPANLRAMCQRCHLNYDRHLHAANAARTRAATATAGAAPLFTMEVTASG